MEFQQKNLSEKNVYCSDIGEKGILQWIPKSQLHCDNKYQRNTSDKRAERIASDFKWISFGCVVVVRRPDGAYFVTDGYHRVTAAKLRNDVDCIPCFVFESTIKKEAESFVDMNKGRKSITGMELWKAQNVSNDKRSIAVKAILDEYGYKICDYDESPNCFKCPQAVIDAYDQGFLESILKFFIEVWGRDILCTQNAVIRGICLYAKSIKSTFGYSLNDVRAREKFINYPVARAMKDGIRIAVESGTSRHYGFFVAMRRVFNKGKQIRLSEGNIG